MGFWLEEKTHLKKKGLNQVLPGCPGHGSTWSVNRVLPDFIYPSFLAYPNWSSH
jgi:hypothetical protein